MNPPSLHIYFSREFLNAFKFLNAGKVKREKKGRLIIPSKAATCSFFREHPSNAIVIFLSTLDDEEKTEKGWVRARGANERAESPFGKLPSRSCDLTDTRDRYMERFFSSLLSLFLLFFFHSQRKASVLDHNTIGRRLDYELIMRGLSSILSHSLHALILIVHAIVD